MAFKLNCYNFMIELINVIILETLTKL